MKACVLEEPENYQIKDIPIPEIREDGVLVRVLISGICVNDVGDCQGCKQSYPRIDGHEYSTVIEYIGTGVDPSLFHIDDKVIDYIIDNCGVCPDRKHHHENICNNFTKRIVHFSEDGFSGFYGFSEYAVAEACHLYVYPEETPDDEVVFTEPLAYVTNGTNRPRIKMGDGVVVIGGGVVGLPRVLCARRQGAHAILDETDIRRRAFGLKLGTDNMVDPLEFGPVEQVKKLTNNRGVNAVENTTAIPSIAVQAIQMTARSGLCNMFSSIHPNGPILVDTGHLHSQEIVVIGIQNETIGTFIQAIDCISKGIVDAKPLVEAVYDHEDVVGAMEYIGRPDTYKVMLRLSE